MEDKKLEEVLQIVDPKRRVFLKRLVVGAAFAVPIVASYSVNELGAQVIGSPGTTTTDALTTSVLTATTMTTTDMMTATTVMTTTDMMTATTMMTATITMTTTTTQTF